MSAFGIDSQPMSYDELGIGEFCKIPVLLDSTATAVVGQVLKYDSSAANWVNATDIAPDAAGFPLVVCAEAATLTADTAVLCIVKGRVRFDKLDATSQAFTNIKATLIASGIIPVSGITA